MSTINGISEAEEILAQLRLVAQNEGKLLAKLAKINKNAALLCIRNSIEDMRRFECVVEEL